MYTLYVYTWFWQFAVGFVARVSSLLVVGAAAIVVGVCRPVLDAEGCQQVCWARRGDGAVYLVHCRPPTAPAFRKAELAVRGVHLAVPCGEGLQGASVRRERHTQTWLPHLLHRNGRREEEHGLVVGDGSVDLHISGVRRACAQVFRRM